MASILDRYGIKEVADVTFYEINKDSGKPERPVLFLDTLKVSTIEQTAENTEARGGKGNAALISWDYNKEINVTLEDALFSPKSMAIMFGDGLVKKVQGTDIGTSPNLKDVKLIMKTETFRAKINVAKGEGASAVDDVKTGAEKAGWDPLYYNAKGNKKFNKQNPKFYDEYGQEITLPSATNKNFFEIGQKYFCTFDLIVIDGTAVIEISANSFPGTYYVTGDTYARSDASGDDEFFQFIIPKAKVTSENTITLEAEGDPSVFNMNLRVLRPEDGIMMKLVKYDLDIGTDIVSGGEAIIEHNHVLDTITNNGIVTEDNISINPPAQG